MAGKKFTNQTKYDLAVILKVRAGSIPGKIKENKSFTLAHEAQMFVPYGDAANPFVDGLSITGMADGSLTAETIIIMDKSSTVDDLFNRHDTIDITYDNGVFKLGFRNTWAAPAPAVDGMLPWDDWFYHLSYRRNEVNTLHQSVLSLQDVIQTEIGVFNKNLKDYQTLVAANSALLIIKNVIQMDELKYKDYRTDVDAVVLPVDGNPILAAGELLAEIIGCGLLCKAIFDIFRIGKSFFSAAPEVIAAGESCLESGLAEASIEAAANVTSRVGAEVGVQAAERAIQGASCASLAGIGIGILVAVGLDMIFGAIDGAKEKKELDKQITALSDAVTKSTTFFNTVHDKEGELAVYILKEEKRFVDLLQDLAAITGQKPTFEYLYPATITELEHIMTAQGHALQQYGVFQTMKESWVTAITRNPALTKDQFLAMLINFVPQAFTLETLTQYWEVLKKHSDTMSCAEH